MIPSKETFYNGYRFRSRTEARWAVFFDAAGIMYYYEHEDFLLPSGKRYLPDFWLPELDSGVFFEVKGISTADEKEKCRDLCFLTKHDVLIADGPPDFRPFTCYKGLYREYDYVDAPPEIIDFDAILEIIYSKPLATPVFEVNELTGWFNLHKYRIEYSEYHHDDYEVFKHFGIFKPILAARSARFEFLNP